MVPDATLKDIRRKVYMSYFKDGLWDMVLGAFLLCWGLMIMFEMVALIGAFCMAFYFLVLGLKKWLTYPRMGYVKIAEAQRQKLRMVIAGIVLFGLGLMVFFLFTTGNRPAWLSEYFMFLFGTMVAVIILLLASWWKVGRWYAYGGLVFTSFAFHQWLNTILEYSFIIPGSIILLSGLVLLIHFLRKYSLPDMEKPSEDR